MSNTAVIDIPIDMMDRLGTATFDELARFAEESIASAGEHAQQAIHFLISAGGAFCEMRDRMPGQFTAWLRESGINPSWASRCQRLFAYRNELPREAFEACLTSHGRRVRPTLERAIQSISHLPSLSSGGWNKIAEDRKATIDRLLAEGASVPEIARLTGISRAAIQEIKKPGAVAASRRRSQEKKKLKATAEKALREQEQRAERDRLAKITGKEASVAYAAVRQALAALAKVSGSAAHVDAATGYLTAAESRIVAIMQEERASQ